MQEEVEGFYQLPMHRRRISWLPETSKQVRAEGTLPSELHSGVNIWHVARVPPQVSTYTVVRHEMQLAHLNLLSPSTAPFSDKERGAQRHNLAAQIVAMRCIRHSLKVALVLSANFNLRVACGRVLQPLGPLALLHEPLHEPTATMCRKHKKRSRSGTPGKPKKLRKRELRPPSTKPLGRIGRPRKGTTPTLNLPAKSRRRKSKHAKPARCASARHVNSIDSEVSCGEPFAVPLNTWRDGPCTNSLGKFGEVRLTRGSTRELAEAVRRDEGANEAAGTQLDSVRKPDWPATHLGACGDAEAPALSAGKACSTAVEPLSAVEGCPNTAEELSHAAETALSGQGVALSAREAAPHAAEVALSAREAAPLAAEEPGIAAKEPVSVAAEPTQLDDGESSEQAAGLEEEHELWQEEWSHQVHEPLVKADSPVNLDEEENPCAGDSTQEEDGHHAVDEPKPLSGLDDAAAVDVELVPYKKDVHDDEEYEEEVVRPQLPALKPIRMPPVADKDNFCSVCGDEDEDDPENVVIMCEGLGCQVVVHQQCYGLAHVPSGVWLCDGCAAGIPPSDSACLLCPCSGGALRCVTHYNGISLPPSPRSASAAAALATLAEVSEADGATPSPLAASLGRSDHSSASAKTAERLSGDSNEGLRSWVDSQPTPTVGSSIKDALRAASKMPDNKVRPLPAAPLSSRGERAPAPIHAPAHTPANPPATPPPQAFATIFTSLAYAANLASQPQPAKLAKDPQLVNSAVKRDLPLKADELLAKRRRSNSEGPWVHSACALWAPGVGFLDSEALDAVNLEALTQQQINVRCTYCKQGGGGVVRCNVLKCRTAVHVICARNAGCVLPISDAGTVLTFCGQHSHDRYSDARELMINDENPEAAP